MACKSVNMLLRHQAIEALVSAVDETTGIVSALGFISRDLFALGPQIRQRSFFCMGSMGSVIPFSLGVTLAVSDRRILALEGDGSLLMNAGSLVSVLRYGGPNLGIVLFDNGIYESTGGQPSQPPTFLLEQFCAGVGLATAVAHTAKQVEDWVRRVWPQCEGPPVLVIKTTADVPSPRIPSELSEITSQFSAWLRLSRY